MNDINVPIQEEVNPKEVLDVSAEKLADIASKLAGIFKTGFDAGFIGAKTKALMEAYKQDVKDYINEQLDLIVKGESADGVLNTIKELREALNNDADAFSTLMDKISESSVSIAANKEAITGLKESTVKSRAKSATTTLRLYATIKEVGDHMVIPSAITGSGEASESANITDYPNYVSSIMKRDSIGRCSVMRPEHPKHIANKEYVDESIKDIEESVNETNDTINGILTSTTPQYKVKTAEYAYKARYLTPTKYDDAVGKGYVDNKVAEVAEELSKVINGAPEALDNLLKISEALKDDDNAIAALTTTIADNKTAAEKYADEVGETVKTYVDEKVDLPTFEALTSEEESKEADYSLPEEIRERYFNTAMVRDRHGRCSVFSPYYTNNIANKGYVDNAIATLSESLVESLHSRKEVKNDGSTVITIELDNGDSTQFEISSVSQAKSITNLYLHHLCINVKFTNNTVQLRIPVEFTSPSAEQYKIQRFFEFIWSEGAHYNRGVIVLANGEYPINNYYISKTAGDDFQYDISYASNSETVLYSSASISNYYITEL